MDFVSARLNMVESQVRTNDVTDVDLVDAMRAIKRERFCPADKAPPRLRGEVGGVRAGPVSAGPAGRGPSWCSRRPARPGERALAIAGPYAAAMLARSGD
jgi:protein-L-isoaspartate(D-aspartate) O-methyltransferase